MKIAKKNKLLILGFILSVLIGYWLSFSNAIKVKNQYKTLQGEAAIFDNISDKLHVLNRQNKHYDSILKSNRIYTKSSFQTNLLASISNFADSTDISIVSFKNPHIFNADNANIYTYNFTLKGSFNQLIRLIYQLEHKQKFGKIISVIYQKKKNYSRNSEFLECTVLLQNTEQE